MSFFRWSSMNWSCDLYCYESEQGYVTHVAMNRVAGDIPKVDPSILLKNTEENLNKFIAQQKAQHAFLDIAERKPIGLKYDGQTFYDCKESFLDRLATLRKEGYNFPDITEEDLE